MLYELRFLWLLFYTFVDIHCGIADDRFLYGDVVNLSLLVDSVSKYKKSVFLINIEFGGKVYYGDFLEFV